MNDEEKLLLGRDLYDASYANAIRSELDKETVQSEAGKGLIRGMHVARGTGPDGLERVILTPNSADARLEFLVRNWNRNCGARDMWPEDSNEANVVFVFFCDGECEDRYTEDYAEFSAGTFKEVLRD